MNISYLFLLKNSIIRNEDETTGGGVSWLTYWEDITNDKFDLCAVCENKAQVGAHVSGLGFHNIGIVPLCIGCNNKRGKQLMTKLDTKMVCVTEKEIKRIIENQVKKIKEKEKEEKEKEEIKCAIENQIKKLKEEKDIKSLLSDDEFVHVSSVNAAVVIEKDVYYKTSLGKKGKLHIKKGCFGATSRVIRKNVVDTQICKDCIKHKK